MLRNVKAVKAARGPSGFVLASFVEAVSMCYVTISHGTAITSVIIKLNEREL